MFPGIFPCFMTGPSQWLPNAPNSDSGSNIRSFTNIWPHTEANLPHEMRQRWVSLSSGMLCKTTQPAMNGTTLRSRKLFGNAKRLLQPFALTTGDALHWIRLVSRQGNISNTCLEYSIPSSEDTCCKMHRISPTVICRSVSSLSKP